MKIRKQVGKSPHGRETEFRNPRNFGLWNLESWLSGIRDSAQGRGNPTNDANPKSKFHWQRIWNPVPGTQNPRRRIQNPRLSWIPLHGVTDKQKSSYRAGILSSFSDQIKPEPRPLFWAGEGGKFLSSHKRPQLAYPSPSAGEQLRNWVAETASCSIKTDSMGNSWKCLDVSLGRLALHGYN